MCAAEVTAFPWALVIGGGIGIAGTLLGAHLNNRAAEKRQLAEQRHQDRTRLHKEKVEIYARVINSAKTYIKAEEKRQWPTPALGDEFLDPTPSREKTRTPFAEARETISLVASADVVNVADSLFGAATTLEKGRMDEETFDRWVSISTQALEQFRKAARIELAVPP